MTAIPTQYHDLLNEKRALAFLATTMPDGSPQVTPVWVDFDGSDLVLNTAKGRVKYRNIQRQPKVAVAVGDPDNPYRYVQVRGTARMTEEGADEHIDKLAKKYLGVDKYAGRAPGEQRVRIIVRPEHVGAMA